MIRTAFLTLGPALGFLLIQTCPAAAQDAAAGPSIQETVVAGNDPDGGLVIVIPGKRFQESEPDGHAPVGVMGDHVHLEREWMLSYRYKRMEMDGNRDGTNDLTTGEVLNRFMVAPLRMTMEMHMFSLMYGATEDFTVVPMLPYVKKSMDHINRMGVQFTTRSDGIGDFRLSGLYKIFERTNHQIVFNLGVSFPTGSINEKDQTPADPSGVNPLPYPMQLGSGTYDVLPGFTYRGYAGDFSWGGQAMGTVRTGDNSHDYRLGNRFLATGWSAQRFNDWLSGSLRVAWEAWENIHGADPKA